MRALICLILALSCALPTSAESVEAPGEAVIQELIAGLVDRDFRKSSAAIDELVRLGSVAVPALEAVLRTEEDVWARRRAVTALERIGGSEVVPALLIAAADKEEIVAAAAAKAIVGLGQEGVTLLFKSLVSESWSLRRGALLALEQAGYTRGEIASELLPLLATNRTRTESDGVVAIDPQANLRERVALFLGELGPDAKPAVPVLRAILESEDEERALRLAALAALREIDPASVSGSAWLLTLGWGGESLYQLGNMGVDALIGLGREAIPALTSAVRGGNPAARTWAAYILGELGPEASEAVEALRDALAGPEWYAAWEAAHALTRVAPERDDVRRESRLVKESLQMNGDAVRAREGSDVVVSEGDGRVVLENGILRMEIERRSGRLVELRNADGVDLLGGGSAYINAHFRVGGREVRWSFNDAEYRLLTHTPDFAEVEFRREAQGEVPFDMALRYVMQRGESGFYWYLAVGPVRGDEAVSFSFIRMTTRISAEVFTHAALSDGRVMRLPSPEVQAQGVEVMDATFRLPDGTVYTKYDFAASMGEHQFHGAMGERFGIWSIYPSHEFLNGGPTKQYNTIHAAGATHALLNVLHSVHFVGDTRLELNKVGTKLFGPIFLYVNSGSSREEMWVDAQRRAEVERARWPYPWVDHPAFPLERGSVTGRLRRTDGGDPGGSWVVLAAGEPEWQKQANGYIYWTRTDASGAFTVSNVRPGEYTLYAFAPGVLGELRREKVVVNPGEDSSLGVLEWTPEARGRLLWEIGVPDRSAREFRRGDQTRAWGLWRHYAKDFPEGVRFVVGESDWRTDWNYLQPVKLFADDGVTHIGESKPWEILFDLDERVTGKAYLTLAIAGSSEATLSVRVNGVEVHQARLANDSSIHRGGHRGFYREILVPFEGSLLKEGRNAVALDVSGNSHYAGVMYDYLRLEAELAPPGAG